MTEGRGEACRDPSKGVLKILPGGRRLLGPAGETILRVLQQHAKPIGGSCGGQGTCGECKVRLVNRAPKPTATDWAHLSEDEISSGWRLACAHALGGAATIEIQSQTGELNHKATHDRMGPIQMPDPIVRLRSVPPSASPDDDNRSLEERIRETLGDRIHFTPWAQQRLADVPEGEKGAVSIMESRGEVIALLPETASEVCGLAIDVGATTLAAHLFDLTSGRQLGVAASRNPQGRFGADVIARIAHIRRHSDSGLAELHTAVIDGLNTLIDRLAAESSVSPVSICGVTVVGNPTMLHLLLSVDPRGIDVSPFVPAFTNSIRRAAEDVGLAIHPQAIVETLPAISAYVGADIVAGMLATDLRACRSTALFLDVGANGEIVLALGERLLDCRRTRVRGCLSYKGCPRSMGRSTRSESTESRSSVQRSQVPSRSGSAERDSSPPSLSYMRLQSSTRLDASPVTGHRSRSGSTERGEPDASG